jgi:hypothetical protein
MPLHTPIAAPMHAKTVLEFFPNFFPGHSAQFFEKHFHKTKKST